MLNAEWVQGSALIIDIYIQMEVELGMGVPTPSLAWYSNKKSLAKKSLNNSFIIMSAEAIEFIKIFEALPLEKKVEVTDFARFLYEKSEDERWEKIISDDKPRTKLEEFAQASEQEESELLDFKKL